MSSGDHPLKADLLLVLATLVAAAGWIFSKEALAGMPPLQFVGVRFLLAGVVLAALGRNQLRALDRAGLRGSLLVGTLFAVAMAFWIKGLEHARHLGEGAFISSLGIVLVPLIGRLFFGDRPPRLTWVAMPVALGGFACLSLEHGFRFEPGQWFFIAAAVVFAILLNLNSRVVRNVSPLALSAIQVSMVGGLMLPLSALTESWPDAVSTPVLGWLLASALIATTLRFFIQLYGQSLTTPSHAAVILMLEPMWTAIVAAWWFGERMTTLQFVGCGLIFAALVLSRWPWIRALMRTALK
ncbi:DMT family transporter [Thauera sp.]|uniref:DMT family transporter n=1 Tax=Thauera sp. TaxID=1905334 RepID=UPI00257CAC62|nr:DMT family transporter [Thauera sp.]